MAKQLAQEEGLLVGISAAAAVSAAFHLGAELEYGLIVVLLPDSAGKYLDMDFWRDEQ
jgi:cysteine synthase